MSIFGEILQQTIASVPGAQGAVFVDWEGEAVDEFSRVGRTDIRLVGAHWGVIYYQTRELFDRNRLGPVHLLVLQFERQSVVVRRVTTDYFVVLALAERGSNLGRALRALDEAERLLLEQM